jgi:hypothetical protein
MFNVQRYYDFKEKNILHVFYAEIRHSTYVQSFVKSIFSISKFLPVNFMKNLDRDIKVMNSILQKNLDVVKSYTKVIDSSKVIYQEFTNLPATEYSETTYDGRVIQLHYRTDKSTGILFNELYMNQELCIAKYKKFYKFHESFISTFSHNTNDSDNLYIFRKEKNGNTLPHFIIKNTKDGIMMEILVLSNSYYNSVERILFFIDNAYTERNIISSKQIGLIGKFEYIDASFQYYLLADMIMNNKFFSPFLLLNDSDKISRDNKSIYLYFRSELEEITLSDSLGVGGWTKDQSRFGHLTASLYPYKRNEKEYFITVKIHRAQNENVLDQFKYILARLLSLYKREEESTFKYFRQYLPSLNKEPVELKAISTKAGSLGYENALLFPGEYVRCCQKNRKPILLKTLADVEALELPENEVKYRILKYPKEPYDFEDTVIQPAYYFAANPSEPYMGYVKMKNLKKSHPFGGYVPCTFSRVQTTKNLRVEKEIYENTIVQRKKKNTNLYRAKKKKVISNTGQVGDLPKELIEFFYMFLPNYSFVHVGISDSLVNSSLFMACFYATNMTLKEVPSNFRELLLQQNLQNTGAQENCVVGMSNVNNILKSTTATMDVRYFYTIMERYFRIRLIVVNYDGTFVVPNSCYEYYYVDYENDPIVILLEHESPIRYEIIGYQTDSGLQLSHDKDSDIFEDLKFLRKEYLKTYSRNDIIEPFASTVYDSLFFNVPLFGQILSKTGQTRILFTKTRELQIPFFLEKALPPFALPIVESTGNLPSEYEVFNFLMSNIFTVRALVYVSSTEGYFRLKEYPMCIPFIRNTKNDDRKKQYRTESFHPFQFYFSSTEKILEKILYVFILSVMIKNYLLYEFKLNKNVQDNENTIINFFPKTSFQNKELSPLVKDNTWLHHDGKVKLPSELKDTIQYFLEWNQIMNKADVQSWKKRKELDYFQFSTQFQTKFGNNIQTSEKVLPNIIYQDYYEFDNLKELPQDLKEDTIYYRYDAKKEIFHQFFLHKIVKSEAKQIQKSKLISVMEYYFEFGIFTWDVYSSSTTTPQFSNKYKIYDDDSFFLCFFDFV